MMSLRRTAAAEDDLIAIWLRIAEDDQRAADRMLDRFADAERRLASFPEIGMLRPELGVGIRAIFVRGHALFYRTVQSQIEIVRVMDGRREIRAEDLAPR